MTAPARRRRPKPAESAVDWRACPTCKHRHPNGIGVSFCLCDDCSLIWSDVPRHLLGPDYKKRLDALEKAMEKDR